MESSKKLSLKARERSKYKEDLGPPKADPPSLLEASVHVITLEDIGRVVEQKVINLTTKECIENLKQTVVDQNLRIQEL